MNICTTTVCISGSRLLRHRPHRHIFVPLEICHAFIDLLADDLATLRSSSVTCRAFLGRSRHHLFRRIVLHSPEQWDSVLFMLQRDRQSAEAVRELEIDNRPVQGRTPHWLDPVSINLLPMLSSLEQLIINLPLPQRVHHPTLFTALSEFPPSVVALSLTGYQFASFTDLTRFLLIHPSVKHLILHSVDFHEDETNYTNVNQPFEEISGLSLSTLSITNFSSSGNFTRMLVDTRFSRWLGTTSAVRVLQHLELKLRITEQASADGVQDLIFECRHTLQTLVLDFATHIDPDQRGMYDCHPSLAATNVSSRPRTRPLREHRSTQSPHPGPRLNFRHILHHRLPGHAATRNTGSSVSRAHQLHPW